MARFRRRPAPAYNENGDLTDVAVRDDAATDRLQGNGLNVKQVTRNPSGNLTIEWRGSPTEAQRAFADELVPGAAHAF